MSNLIAFNSTFERAMRVESGRKSFNESLTVNVPTPVILFAKSHIDMLEEQVSKLQEQVRQLRIKSVTVSGEELNRRIDQNRDSSFGIA